MTGILSLIARFGRRILPSVLGTGVDSRFAEVLDGGFDAVVLFDGEGKITSTNRAARRLFPQLADGFAGTVIDDLVRLSENATTGLIDLPVPRGCLPPRDALGLRSDTDSFPVEISLVDLEPRLPGLRAVFIRDVSDREADQELLRHRATHDALTALPNRYLLLEQARVTLDGSRREERSAGMIIIDLDRFKEINDALGHHSGDLLLTAVAMRLDEYTDNADTLARLGGDEFAVLVPYADVTAVRKKAWRLVRCLTEPFYIEGLRLGVEASAGIATFPDHGESVQEMIQRADVAMYSAKRRRTGVAVYRPEHDKTSLRQHVLTGDLRRAIERGKLELHYQPKLAAETGSLVGVEALARWRHPEFGFIPAEEFIRLAEHTGQIMPLTRWVLETATVQCAQWLRDGFTFGVAVNISARSLLEEELPRLLRRLLNATGLPPRYLTLEITESAIMDDPEKALEVLIGLYALGVGLSIDDFGTGYSSLGYLRKLPASEVKIDKSFVLEMHRNQDDATIVRSIIDLAHNLGVDVVAEGVETREVWDQLRGLGCDVAQGYLFSRPLEPDRLAQWVREWKGAPREEACTRV